MKIRTILLPLAMLLCTVSLMAQQPDPQPTITMTTVQTEGDFSIAIAAGVPGSTVGVDWGDGKFIDYTIDTDFVEVQSSLKGQNLVIRGPITKLNCISSKLSALDVTACPQLQILQAPHNYLTEIDLTKSTELLNLEFFGNTLTEIDLSACTKLIRFVGSGNFLQSIDISHCPNIEYFDCARMRNITDLDLTNAHKLRNLIITDCGLDELALPADAPLQELLCAGNKIPGLNLEGYTALTDLDCSKNPLTVLQVESPVLKNLTAMECQLTSIDLSQVPNLKYLMLTGNKSLTQIHLANTPLLTDLGLSSCSLTNLDLSPLIELRNLWCMENSLTTLDLSKNTKLVAVRAKKNNLSTVIFPTDADSLVTVSLPNNALTTIDLSTLSHTTSLDLGTNQLTSLDLTNMAKLQVLNIGGNAVHKLDLKANPSLNMLGIVGNGMTDCELNAIYAQLPMLDAPSTKINLYNGSKSDVATTTSNTALAKALNWKPSVIGDATGCTDAITDLITDTPATIMQNAHIITVGNPQNQVQYLDLYNSDGQRIYSYSNIGSQVQLTLPDHGMYVIVCRDSNHQIILSQKVIF